MTEKTMEKINKLKKKEACWSIYPVGSQEKGKKLIIEDKDTKRMEEVLYTKYIYNVEGVIHSSEINKETNGALICGKGGKVILVHDNEEICCGYKDSVAKLIALILLNERAICLIYDSALMKVPLIAFASDKKETVNMAGLYKALKKMEFCAGVPRIYEENLKEQGVNVNEQEEK